MKNFFSSFFASLLALMVFCGGGFLLLILLLAAIGASKGEKQVAVQKGSYLVFDLSANIQDKPEQMEGLEQFTAAFGGGGPHTLQLRSVARAIQAAASDSDIAGLYLRGQLMPQGYGSGFGALKEVREAILQFRASGKPVTAYLTYANTRDYYLASAASEVVLDPYGMILMPGLGTQPMFFTGLFDKLGIGVQVTRVGKYKAAVEPFIRKDMSPENRLQTQKLLDDVWSGIVTDIEQSRKLAPGALQAAVDQEGLLRPEAARKFKLVDKVSYYDVVLDELKAATGRKGSKQAFKQIELKDYARMVSGDGAVARRHDPSQFQFGSSGKGRIAVLYAEGEIVDGDGKESEYVWGGTTARQIRELRQDDGVKAIVLRVNSPGGSATASEAIQRELRQARASKPVIVSMGTVAASGGYWISTSSDRIFAEPTTITGSIGVFGMFLNVQGLATDKLGLTFDTVKTGKFADAMTITRPKTEEELAVFQRMVDWIYEQFIGKVAESRHLDPAIVREIAQGRVWSGAEAKKLGLVDEIGGLQAAVKFAAQKAGLGDDYRVSEYPRKKLFSEALTEALENRRHDYAARGALGALVSQVADQWKVLEHLNDPQGVYARLPFELGLR
jgi:protease-4